jgi:phosphoserine phosphatase
MLEEKEIAMSGMRRLLAPVVLLVALVTTSPAWAALPSWNAGATKSAIVAFVEAVTSPGPAFVPEGERVAVFDNDGTLWTEQPVYTEVAFSLARAAELAKADPTLAARPAFQAVLSGDRAQIAALSMTDLMELVAATHSGLTVDAFSAAAAQWLATARHPQSGRAYPESVYQPMLELMDYLRAGGFQVFIVSGGDRDFMRTFALKTYGVAPWQVIGSSNTLDMVEADGGRVLTRTDRSLPDDGPDKVRNLALQIGIRPIFAAGNSDGDLQMLQYTTGATGTRFGLLVHHDDAAREYAYDRQSAIGKLDKALDAAGPAGWTVVSIRDDWRVVFPDEAR